MADGEAKGPPWTPRLLQGGFTVALVGVWLAWLLVQGLRDVARSLTWRRLRRVLGVAALGLLLGSAWVLLPLAWGRARLLHAAANLARRSQELGPDAVASALQREAFKAGFRAPVPGVEAFSVAPRWEEGLALCEVTFAFPQDIALPFGRRVRVTIRGRAQAAVNEEAPRPRSLEDLVQ
jgi:hypothetical protein